MRCHCIPIRVALIKKTENRKYAQGDGEIRTLVCGW